MRDDSSDGTNSHLPAVLSFATTILAWLSWLTMHHSTATKLTKSLRLYIRKECLHVLSRSAVHFLGHLKLSHSGVWQWKSIKPCSSTVLKWRTASASARDYAKHCKRGHLNLLVCLPQLLAGVHQEFVGEHVRQNASVERLWLISRSVLWVLDKVVADFVGAFNSVLVSQSKYNYNTSLTQQIADICSLLWAKISVITVCRTITVSYGVIGCAQVRFSIIRAKSAKAFDSCPASRQLYKALLWPRTSWQCRQRAVGRSIPTWEDVWSCSYSRHPHWWHLLVPPWEGQWTVATACR